MVSGAKEGRGEGAITSTHRWISPEQFKCVIVIVILGLRRSFKSACNPTGLDNNSRLRA